MPGGHLFETLFANSMCPIYIELMNGWMDGLEDLSVRTLILPLL